MPRMHGHAFLSLLRENDRNLPVVVMSAIENQSDLVATMEQVGIYGLISKPVDPEEVTGKIKEVVGPEQDARSCHH